MHEVAVYMTPIMKSIPSNLSYNMTPHHEMYIKVFPLYNITEAKLHPFEMIVHACSCYD